ncbi:MAG: HipA domain-containing protein [Rikenellaceae bacterium]|jgi:serine/threonine-protein kinase HipA|nr:HipA domain-containing protein [Rikenellaceae bacterium]
MTTLDRCPSTLASGYDGYSPVALKRLFDKQTVSHILPYGSIESDREDNARFVENQKRISLSGVQEKYSMVVRDGRLQLKRDDEQGTHILKPKLTQFSNRDFSAANEHLTMQIAAQVFGIETAANALCFFGNGEAAYITRRFDIAPDGSKLRKEDFASLAGLTSENGGKEYKYDKLSYEDIAALIRQYVPAWRVEMLKYFRLTVFNFLFCNGDAHLKNFSLLETSDGDFRLSPAYDLINTRLHGDDLIFALDKGLFREKGMGVGPMGLVTGNSFLEWGKRIGLPENTVRRELEHFCISYPELERLVAASFLSDNLKAEYIRMYCGRRDSFLKAGWERP